MDLQILKTHIQTAQTAWQKILLISNDESHLFMNSIYSNIINKIDNNEYITPEDLYDVSYGGRLLHESPVKDWGVANEVIDDLNPLVNYIDVEYWQKQNDNLA